MPMYEVQLNAYAMIGERCNLHPVSDLALIYMEPVTSKDAVGNGLNYRDKGFAMGFTASVHKVVLNLDIIPPLLARTREINELSKAPEGCTECNDCQLLNELIKTCSI